MIDISETKPEDAVRSYHVDVRSRKVKVIECPMPTLIEGAYQWQDDTIFIDRTLRKYPIAYDNVLKHEIEHAKYRDSNFMHTWIDISNVFRPQPAQTIEFIKSRTPMDYGKLKANLLTWAILISIILVGLWAVEAIWGWLT